MACAEVHLRERVRSCRSSRTLHIAYVAASQCCSTASRVSVDDSKSKKLHFEDTPYPKWHPIHCRGHRSCLRQQAGSGSATVVFFSTSNARPTAKPHLTKVSYEDHQSRKKCVKEEDLLGARQLWRDFESTELHSVAKRLPCQATAISYADMIRKLFQTTSF